MAQLEFNLAHGKAVVAMENEIATKMDMGKTEFKTQMLNQISTQFNYKQKYLYTVYYDIS